jgi:GNAT superfamily N-acetyltransferase
MSNPIVEIREGGLELLPEVAKVSIAFTVKTVLEVEAVDGGLGGLLLRETRLAAPYLKDYDTLDEGGVLGWTRQFDMRNWGFLLAYLENELAGAAVVAHNTPGVHMLEERLDLAVLWDIRVQPNRRGQGLGPALFKASADWACRRGCRTLKIETQNVNVPACRFYRRMGCTLGAIHRHAYAAQPAVAHESMLLWYLSLDRD